MLLTARWFSTLFCFLALVTGVMIPSSFASGPANNIHFLSITDVHFDPFISCYQAPVRPCPLIKKLQQTPAAQWPAILAKYDISAPQYRQDTNYPLLKSALGAASQAAQKEQAQFVMVLGDFLGHDYRRYYKQYALDKSSAGYRTFVRKTMVFLTSEFMRAFPGIDAYAVVGNNDSYRGDYVSEPHGAFFSDTAHLWAGLVKDKNNRAALLREFPTGGYYSVDIPHYPALRLIVLNTVLFSYKAKGKNIHQAANTELDWLHEQLAEARKRRQHVLIAMHIPPGIDVYATLQFRLLRLIELWKTEYTERFEAELKQFAPEISGIFAGHLHTDWFQILTLSNANRVPVTGTPSISPLFGNNPGFKIYTYSFTSHQIDNVETFYYPLSKKRWGLEYTFNRVYPLGCNNCPILKGMDALQQTGRLADSYKYYYAVSTTSQPITNQWKPYYWCATRTVNAANYRKCLAAI